MARRYPLRFVWRMDEDGRFMLDSDEFLALVGARAAAAIGRPWQDMAGELGLDPRGRVARAVATRDTWNGLSVLWPLDGRPERLAVELSGLPVFDRDRIFRGYRGFGICRGVVAAPGAENIVPFRGAVAESSAPALSPVERSAFHELSRKLAQRLASGGIGPRGEAGAANAVTGHGPVASAASPGTETEMAPQGSLSSAESDFLARVSREVRTPLDAIVGLSEVMVEERFGPIGHARYRECLKDIHASASHVVSLVNDLVDLSRIEAGKLDLSFADVSLNDLAHQCVAIMQPQANRQRVIIRTALSPTLPQVVADAPSVRRILLNLLSSSIKLTGAGGQVIVSTALDDSGEVVLRVRDTGIGMSEKDLVAALEPFRRLAHSVHEVSGGSGLGLLLTKALAQANRARFHIKSAPNTGTLVEIAFPANRLPAE